MQYVVKHEQRIDCGGAYIKLLGPDVDQASFGGDTPYQVMFGPDVCGSTQRTHVIFNYPAAKTEEKNLLIKRDVPTRVDQLSHLYTLHVMANNSFNVLIDGESVRFGSLEEEWDFLPPKKIKDPKVSKPEDWVDEEMVRASVPVVGLVNGTDDVRRTEGLTDRLTSTAPMADG